MKYYSESNINCSLLQNTGKLCNKMGIGSLTLGFKRMIITVFNTRYFPQYETLGD